MGCNYLSKHNFNASLINGSGNGVLPDATKQSPEAMSTLSKVVWGCHVTAIPQEVLVNLIRIMHSDISLQIDYHISQGSMS